MDSCHRRTSRLRGISRSQAGPGPDAGLAVRGAADKTEFNAHTTHRDECYEGHGQGAVLAHGREASLREVVWEASLERWHATEGSRRRPAMWLR